MSNKNHLQSRELLENVVRATLQELTGSSDDIIKLIKAAYIDPNDDTISAAAEACLSSNLPRAYCDDILAKLQKNAKTPDAGQVVTNQIAQILDDPENWSRFTKSSPKTKSPIV